MKVQLEPALHGCLSSTPMYATEEDARAQQRPLGSALGDCWVRETPDGASARIERIGTDAPREGFAPIQAVRCTLADKHHVWHRPTTRPFFGARGVPRPEDVTAHGGLRDGALLAVAQSVAASAPAKLTLALHETTRGVRVRTFATVRAPREMLLSNRVLHSRESKPLGPGDAAAWPLFLEKAFAATHDGYESLCKPQTVAEVFTWLLGVPARTTTPILPGWVDDIAELFEAGECVVLHKDDGVFAVVGVARTAGVTGLTLANPAGGSGFFKSQATWTLSEKKPGAKWRGYTRTYFE